MLRFFSLFFLIYGSFACQPGSSSSQQEESELSKALEAYEEEIRLPTGDFGGLLLAYDGQQLTGMYQLVTGNGQFACAFFLQAQFTDLKKKLNFIWYYPGEEEQHTGTLEIIEDTSIKIALQGNPGGQCPPDLLAEGEPFQLEKTDSWKSIRMLWKEASIFEEPDEALQLPGQLLPTTIICILEQKDDWVRFEEPQQGGKMGWIKAENLHPLH